MEAVFRWTDPVTRFIRFRPEPTRTWQNRKPDTITGFLCRISDIFWRIPTGNGVYPAGFSRKFTEYCFRNHRLGCFIILWVTEKIVLKTTNLHLALFVGMGRYITSNHINTYHQDHVGKFESEWKLDCRKIKVISNKAAIKLQLRYHLTDVIADAIFSINRRLFKTATKQTTENQRRNVKTCVVLSIYW
jgi:hypothetical protein